jgi:predicted alpha-1,2-mannosidase
MIMPTVGKVSLNNKHYSSSFKKETEKASAGYYSVFLEKPGVLAELTTTLRTGLHKYTFPKSDQSNIILDLTHRDKLKEGSIQIENDHEISGHRVSDKWASNQHVYFVIQFSKPFHTSGIINGSKKIKGKGQLKGKKLKAYVQFDTEKGEAILVKVGISAVSLEGARKNLEAEQPGFDFDKVLTDAFGIWNKELWKIEVESDNTTNKRIFYTALYHSMIAPNIFQDVDGMYRGRDGNNHTAQHGYYTVFSLWDTYRALHPLLTIIDRKRTSDFIQTFLLQYDQAGLLPIWELAGYETFCMIGYHALPVIAGAYLKGIEGIDSQKALEAMRRSAETDNKELKKYKLPGKIIVDASYYRYKKGMGQYMKNGYIKNSFMSGSVAKTLEFAYDDWCLAQMAKALDSTDVYNTYIQRAANYQNVYDPSTGFMRARKGKGFVKKFDPFKASHNIYCEANAWHYSFSAPQDVSGLMKLAGGKEQYSQFLDSLFNAPSQVKGAKAFTLDISGLIGQYAHGNEPSHHIGYLYNYTGYAWKTQSIIRRIMSELYFDRPNGLPGNEDCGQMSAWYVFSALGFYPVCPGSDHYAIGSPLFEKASMHLENGQTFTVIANGTNEKNVYIQSATLNGKPFTKSYLTFADIANGGVLEFQMGDTPNKRWGTGVEDIPVLSIISH